MHFHVNLCLPQARVSPADFVVSVTVDVMAPSIFSFENLQGSDSSSELAPSPADYLVGRAWAERMDWSLAESLGYSPLDICDEVSGAWLNVYKTLRNKKGNGFRRDLNLVDYVSDMLFVHEMLLHPDIEDRIAVVDAILRGMSGDNSLVLMNYENGLPHNLENWEYRDLGFKKISRSTLLLRDNHFQYPFAEAHLGGREVRFSASAEHEEWLLERWQNLVVDYPYR